MRRLEDELIADPFDERSKAPYRRNLVLLGARFEVTSNSRALLKLFDSAFSHLPRPARIRARAARKAQPRRSAPVIRLALTLRKAPRSESTRRRDRSPPGRMPSPLRLESGAGFLSGMLDDAGSAVLAPKLAAGLIRINQELLRHPYHLRYELLEFAVYTLAARVGSLVPLHGACIGDGSHAVLILGDSGAGKSTLAAHCLLEGLNLLSEDSVFVDPEGLRALSVPNFLHLRRSSLPVLGPAARNLLRGEPGTITRRSGVRKIEIDLRRRPFRIDAGPTPLAAIVFLSAAPAAGANLLRPLSRDVLRKRLARTQPYAAAQREWPGFLRDALALPAYELRRGAHLHDASAHLRTLLRCASH